jgi:hypothetical protein
MVEAHMRDAVALCDHFSWMEEKMQAGEQVTEVELDEHLTACRAVQPGFVGPSFPTIAGCNANGAIIHYRCAAPHACMPCSAVTLHRTPKRRTGFPSCCAVAAFAVACAATPLWPLWPPRRSHPHSGYRRATQGQGGGVCCST